jgi:hypothetical protein
VAILKTTNLENEIHQNWALRRDGAGSCRKEHETTPIGMTGVKSDREKKTMAGDLLCGQDTRRAPATRLPRR